MSLPEVFLIRGLREDGSVVWYTGRSGAAFVAEERSSAFAGFDKEGARRKAGVLNRTMDLHGVRFVAVPEAA